MDRFNVINAKDGQTILANVTTAEFDRWYDAHCFWRQPRGLEEVAPHLRSMYIENNDGDEWLVEG